MSKIVCLKTFPDYLEADMAKSLLEANGIKASVSADDAGGMRPDLAFTSGGVRLFVLDENADKSLELLASESPCMSDSSNPDGSADSDIVCYHCGILLPEQLAKCPSCAGDLDWS